MSQFAKFFRRVRLRYLLFLFLLLFGILPLLFSSISSLRRNRDLLEQQEKVNLSRQAEHLSRQLGLELQVVVRQLEQLGAGLRAMPLDSSSERADDQGVAEEWLQGYLEQFVRSTGDDFTTRVTFLQDERVFGSRLPEELDRALALASEGSTTRSGPRFDWVEGSREDQPWALVTLRIAQPVLGEGESDSFILQAAKRLAISSEEGKGVFLLDAENGGRVLWADRRQAELVRAAVARSVAVQEGLRSTAVAYPVFEYPMRIGSSRREMIGQLSKLADTGWVVLVQKRKEAALGAVRSMVRDAILTVSGTVLLALLVGGIATRALSHPIQELAETSKEIASGRFGQRVASRGAGREIVELADSFNQMSAHVQSHVERLKKAAQVNRELFIGSIRALLAAIEAKEPYTRGHSERVAAYSQAIARHLDDDPEFAEQIWIAGLLHDVGKIGIEDRVLNKGDVLTDEEFEIMKRHPVVGAEIMSSIQQLRSLLPAIRWHHERWVGGGYPDGLVGEDIPLMARIVAVADTFDAITTQRVYQNPYTPEQAVAIIRKVSGEHFDPRIVQAFLAARERGDIQLLPSSRDQKTVELVDETEVVHT